MSEMSEMTALRTGRTCSAIANASAVPAKDLRQLPPCCFLSTSPQTVPQWTISALIRNHSALLAKENGVQRQLKIMFLAGQCRFGSLELRRCLRE
jgi:hypothetical protein